MDHGREPHDELNVHDGYEMLELIQGGCILVSEGMVASACSCGTFAAACVESVVM